jgi:hypothetical protein
MAVARIVGEYATRLWRVLQPYVNEAYQTDVKNNCPAAEVFFNHFHVMQKCCQSVR